MVVLGFVIVVCLFMNYQIKFASKLWSWKALNTDVDCARCPYCFMLICEFSIKIFTQIMKSIGLLVEDELQVLSSILTTIIAKFTSQDVVSLGGGGHENSDYLGRGHCWKKVECWETSGLWAGSTESWCVMPPRPPKRHRLPLLLTCVASYALRVARTRCSEPLLSRDGCRSRGCSGTIKELTSSWLFFHYTQEILLFSDVVLCEAEKLFKRKLAHTIDIKRQISSAYKSLKVYDAKYCPSWVTQYHRRSCFTFWTPLCFLACKA